MTWFLIGWIVWMWYAGMRTELLNCRKTLVAEHNEATWQRFRWMALLFVSVWPFYYICAQAYELWVICYVRRFGYKKPVPSQAVVSGIPYAQAAMGHTGVPSKAWKDHGYNQ